MTKRCRHRRRRKHTPYGLEGQRKGWCNNCDAHICPPYDKTTGSRARHRARIEIDEAMKDAA